MSATLFCAESRKLSINTRPRSHAFVVTFLSEELGDHIAVEVPWRFTPGRQRFPTATSGGYSHEIENPAGIHRYQ